MADHSDDDEPADPVEAMNQADERRFHELLALDLDLDAAQEALERLWHRDAVGMAAFGDQDQWIDERLGDDR